MKYAKTYITTFIVAVCLLTYTGIMFWLMSEYNLVWPFLVSMPVILLISGTAIIHSTASIKCAKCGKEYGANTLLSGLNPLITKGQKCQWCGHKNV